MLVYVSGGPAGVVPLRVTDCLTTKITIMKKESLDLLRRIIMVADNSDNAILAEFARQILRLEEPEPSCKFDMWKYTASDPNRPLMGCIFHNNGERVASDCHILVVEKCAYPEEYEGKMLNKAGEFVEGKYPNYYSVKPAGQPESVIPITPELESQTKEMIKGWKAYKKEHGKYADFGTKTEKYHVTIGDVWLDCEQMLAFLVFAKHIGATEIRTFGISRAVLSESENGWCILMPLFQG